MCSVSPAYLHRFLFIIKSVWRITTLLFIFRRRSNARRVIAVIPYFGYKHHRRGASLSTKHKSRFLSSNSMDFAKMLQEMGVDRVIAVDIQRPGQGGEACFCSRSRVNSFHSCSKFNSVRQIQWVSA